MTYNKKKQNKRINKAPPEKSQRTANTIRAPAISVIQPSTPNTEKFIDWWQSLTCSQKVLLLTMAGTTVLLIFYAAATTHPGEMQHNIDQAPIKTNTHSPHTHQDLLVGTATTPSSVGWASLPAPLGQGQTKTLPTADVPLSIANIEKVQKQLATAVSQGNVAVVRKILKSKDVALIPPAIFKKTAVPSIFDSRISAESNPFQLFLSQSNTQSLIRQALAELGVELPLGQPDASWLPLLESLMMNDKIMSDGPNERFAHAIYVAVLQLVAKEADPYPYVGIACTQPDNVGVVGEQIDARFLTKLFQMPELQNKNPKVGNESNSKWAQMFVMRAVQYIRDAEVINKGVMDKEKMDMLLKSEGFKFRIFEFSEESSLSAFYHSYKNTVYISPRKLFSFPKLISSLRHEATHGFNTILNKGANPEVDLLLAAISCNVKQPGHCQQFGEAMDKGSYRILTELPALLQKKECGSLSGEDQIILTSYLDAIEDAYQCERGIQLFKGIGASSGASKALKEALEDGRAMGTKEGPIAYRAIRINDINFYAIFRTWANSEAYDKVHCFIRDYRAIAQERIPVYRQQFSNIKDEAVKNASLITEFDSMLSELPPRVLQIFFPETMQFRKEFWHGSKLGYFRYQ